MRRFTIVGMAAVVAGALIGGVLATAAQAGVVPATAQAQYVALGDSYTSGPLLQPVAAGAPFECFRSGVNYPHLVAAAEGLWLTDRSCSGATTPDMTTAQSHGQGPQFDALGPATRLVTIGIGGDDHGLFVDALLTCSAIDIFDPFDIASPCRSAEGSKYADDVRSDAVTVGAALDEIHLLSPGARIFVVGYPDILPQHGNCYPRVPLSSGDVAYLNGIELDLDSMLRTEAQTHQATYVDTYTPSIGHDACQSESVRWIEPPVPSTEAFPVHPNSRGEAADAADVEAALHAAGLS